MNKKIVLASQSPRRRELIALLDLPFQVVSPDTEEIFEAGLSLEEQLKKIAREKAVHVLKTHDDALVISADTIVVYHDEILEKPLHAQDAKDMLKKLSGNTHQVWTAVCMISSKEEETFLVKSDVKFYELDEKEIENYVSTSEPLDKAGGYNIHGYGALFVESVQGDHFAIMGLPIAKVYQFMKNKTW